MSSPLAAGHPLPVRSLPAYHLVTIPKAGKDETAMCERGDSVSKSPPYPMVLVALGPEWTYRPNPSVTLYTDSHFVQSPAMIRQNSCHREELAWVLSSVGLK
ncbi:hypothetical protein CLV78_105135 [Aliiruegeria haliotis]|uniref:Uncharacterized protein n=1 Tax=Aliiruegeria haliotis TaxID=1280846 RepID=A0A2T0RPR7_9RHOB|nr:hypothetical protein CLV78_105135 [Aliiruegeria haliotis]